MPPASVVGGECLARRGVDLATVACSLANTFSFKPLERLAGAAARPVERDVENLGDAGAVAAHHHDPVGQRQRLVDVVGDQHQGRPVLAPRPPAGGPAGARG